MKFGKCHRCPKHAHPVRLYGDGVCAYHLGHPEEHVVRSDAGAERRQQRDADKALNSFYDQQVRCLPCNCENCNRLLPGPDAPAWLRRASVAHIVPKRDFESVQVHPDNVWYACGDCHTNYDDKGWTYAVTMRVWPVVVERFRRFMCLIKDTERRLLPDALRTVMEEGPPC